MMESAKKYFKTPKSIAKVGKIYAIAMLVISILAWIVVYVCLATNRVNHFYSEGEYSFQQYALSSAAFVGVLVMFAGVGRILIQLVVWKTYLGDENLRKLGFLAIMLFFVSILIMIIVYKIYSVYCKSQQFYSFEWVIEEFIICLFSGDVFLAFSFWLLEYLQKKFGITYLPND